MAMMSGARVRVVCVGLCVAGCVSGCAKEDSILVRAGVPSWAEVVGPAGSGRLIVSGDGGALVLLPGYEAGAGGGNGLGFRVLVPVRRDVADRLIRVLHVLSDTPEAGASCSCDEPDYLVRASCRGRVRRAALTRTQVAANQLWCGVLGEAASVAGGALAKAIHLRAKAESIAGVKPARAIPQYLEALECLDAWLKTRAEKMETIYDGELALNRCRVIVRVAGATKALEELRSAWNDLAEASMSFAARPEGIIVRFTGSGLAVGLPKTIPVEVRNSLIALSQRRSDCHRGGQNRPPRGGPKQGGGSRVR